MQNSIAAESNRIYEWEKQCNSYLKTMSGYASSLKACTHLYNDGVRTFLTLEKLGKMIRNNPQGTVASTNMNNLYIETTTELASMPTLLNDTMVKGGMESMLTGTERSKTLWVLNGQLTAFSRKLYPFYLSLRCHTLNDVWDSIAAGMIDRSNDEVVHLVMSRWRRVAATARRKKDNKKRRTIKRIISIWALLLCIGISKVQAQNDATLAGMILVYANKAEKELRNQEGVMLTQTIRHVWTKEEVEGTTDLQREFNDYLSSFRSTVCYAA